MIMNEGQPELPIFDRPVSPYIPTPLREMIAHFERRILSEQLFTAVIDPAVASMVAQVAPKEMFALQLTNLLQESQPEPSDMEVVLRGILFAIEAVQRSGRLDFTIVSYDSSAFLDSFEDLDVANLRYEVNEVITNYLLEREVLDAFIEHFKDALSGGNFDKQELARRAAGASFMLLERAAHTSSQVEGNPTN